MENPDIITKIKTSLANPNIKRKMSDNAKRQMGILKLDNNKYNEWIEKQSYIRRNKWNDEIYAKKCLTGLKNARKIMSLKWNDIEYKIQISNKMNGCNNPFYGKKHSPETIEKLRKATIDRLIKFWNTPGIHGFNTKPEQAVKKILLENNIDFITPFSLKHKLYDLYLPKYNVIIEVDGCYWHSKGILPENMSDQQLRRWKNDRYKDSLAMRNGYKIMRVWEDEINTSTLLERIYKI